MKTIIYSFNIISPCISHWGIIETIEEICDRPNSISSKSSSLKEIFPFSNWNLFNCLLNEKILLNVEIFLKIMWILLFKIHQIKEKCWLFFVTILSQLKESISRSMSRENFSFRIFSREHSEDYSLWNLFSKSPLKSSDHFLSN